MLGHRRRSTLAMLATTLLAALPIGAHAQAYPARPVRIIVAFQAGQGTDVATRHLAEQLGRALGQTFLVDNRPGAAGNLGTGIAAKAAPDGYTLVMGTAGTHAMNPALYDNPGFDADKDFEPIAVTGMIPMVISVNASLNAANLADLVAAAKAQPDKIDVALPSTTSRLVHQILRQQAALPLYPVVYKGSASAVPDVAGGQVPVLIDTVTATRPQLGKLRPIAITSARESPLLPGVRSVAEQGVPGFEVTAWNALFAPKGTPSAIIDKLGTELRRILAQPDTIKRLQELGLDAAPPMTTAEVAKFVQSERQKFGTIIKATNMKAD